jgi:CHAT domain-containing protein
VLPTVASLKALRAHAKASRAAEPFIGFGNPLLTGKDGTDKRAWATQNCPPPGIAARVHAAVVDLSQQFASFFRGGLGNVEKVRMLSPLPETADELCAVARTFGIDPLDAAVYLGARATEAQVKQLSASGKLARARIVHFATHGLIAGETTRLAKSRAEPSLILTPPVTASDADDGLLTASEVTTLKLNADWVILSACNTAAGDTVGGDAFSGFARAFFYAGARSLLVSHWYVDSQATIRLINNAFRALKDDPKIGRAEAMRRAMSALITAGGRNAHPANWAPFVVVGEGGAGR